MPALFTSEETRAIKAMGARHAMERAILKGMFRRLSVTRICRRARDAYVDGAHALLRRATRLTSSLETLLSKEEERHERRKRTMLSRRSRRLLFLECQLMLAIPGTDHSVVELEL